jgi:tellurite resistance protein TerC
MPSQEAGHLVLMPDGLMHTVNESEMGRHAMFRHGLMPSSLSSDNDVNLDINLMSNSTAALVNATEDDILQLWDAAASEWTILMCVVLTLVCMDCALSKKLTGHWKLNITVLFFWIMIGLSYNVGYFVRNGEKAGMEWFIGYFLEWMLSIDNLFAFQFILRAYRTPLPLQDKALFYGILGSIVTRGILFMVIGGVLKMIHYIQFAFGFFLIYAGIKSAQDDEEDEKEALDILPVRMLKMALGSKLSSTWDYINGSLFVRGQDGVLSATLMVPLIASIMTADVIFAVDSVTAKVAQSKDLYIAYSSSVLALLGMRSCFHVIEDLVSYFELLKYGVACILVFIGAELMAAGRFQIPEWVVMFVIITIFNFCMVASVLKRLVRADDNTQQSNEADLAAALAVSQDPGSQCTPASSSPSQLTRCCPARASPSSTPDRQTAELRKKLQVRYDAIERQHKDLDLQCPDGRADKGARTSERSHPSNADSAAG